MLPKTGLILSLSSKWVKKKVFFFKNILDEAGALSNSGSAEGENRFL
jgi:hypothetical protein